MIEIESLTKRYAEAAAALGDAVTALEEAKRRLQREHLPAIKRLAARARDARAALAGAIAESPQLFQRPRTVTFHGVRVGIVKRPGRIEFDDAERVVALVRKLYPEQFDVLVKTSYRPVKEALAQLQAADLKRLGITLVADSDEVVIKDASGEIERLVEALLAEEPETVQA
jgi:hypothetical protein